MDGRKKGNSIQPDSKHFSTFRNLKYVLVMITVIFETLATVAALLTVKDMVAATIAVMVVATQTRFLT